MSNILIMCQVFKQIRTDVSLKMYVAEQFYRVKIAKRLKQRGMNVE